MNTPPRRHSDRQLMSPNPLFRKITQVAMVVRDCEATAKRYWDDLGIGPWRFYTLNASNTPDMALYQRPVAHAFRAALAQLGEVMLELIQPLDGDSLYAEHLATQGEGLHHVAFDAANFDEACARLREKGYTEVQSGKTFGICNYAYFDTNKALGCLVELGSELDKGKAFPPPELTYP
jgi:methylmalonyl-CoA/ethylmalonyl-CoA epimerase